MQQLYKWILILLAVMLVEQPAEGSAVTALTASILLINFC